MCFQDHKSGTFCGYNRKKKFEIDENSNFLMPGWIFFYLKHVL